VMEGVGAGLPVVVGVPPACGGVRRRDPFGVGVGAFTETALYGAQATSAFAPKLAVSLQLAPCFRAVRSTDAVLPRYGPKSPPGAGVTPG
jgi:hypothetical protein